MRKFRNTIIAWTIVCGFGLWWFTKGYDLIPDQFQSRSELLCQICEGRAYSGAATNNGYRRLSCTNHTEEKASLTEQFDWMGLNDTPNSPLYPEPLPGLSALMESMPDPIDRRKRSVEISYLLDETMPTERSVTARCQVFVEEGILVQSAQRQFAKYQLLNVETGREGP